MLLQCESSICNIKIDFVISVQIMTLRREAISKAQAGPEGSKLPKWELGRNLTNDFELSACVVHTPALGCKSAFERPI